MSFFQHCRAGSWAGFVLSGGKQAAGMRGICMDVPPCGSAQQRVCCVRVWQPQGQQEHGGNASADNAAAVAQHPLPCQVWGSEFNWIPTRADSCKMCCLSGASCRATSLKPTGNPKISMSREKHTCLFGELPLPEWLLSLHCPLPGGVLD